MRTRVDFVKFLARSLARDFTVDNYDVLTRNCNHFTDAACMFLLNSHIPDEVLTQPELVMGTWTMQLLRPALNRTLGRFEASGTARELESAMEGSSISSDNWAWITKDKLVVWEYIEGWTRIARVLSRCGHSQTCALKWIDVHTGELHMEIGAKFSRVRRLETSI